MDDTKNWIRRQVELQAAERVDTTPPIGAQRSSHSEPLASAARGGGEEPGDDQPGRGQTFVDWGAKFEGTLRLRESFRIDSEFHGEIVSEGTVIVAESAGIEANVCAREVVISGAMVGNVKAGRQVIIRAGGRLHGDVETPCLEVEKGAFFNGRTSMVRPEVAIRDAARVPPKPRDETQPPDGFPPTVPTAHS